MAPLETPKTEAPKWTPKQTEAQKEYFDDKFNVIKNGTDLIQKDTHKDTEKLRSEVSDMLMQKLIEWVAGDFKKEIEHNRKSNTELQGKRNLDVQLQGNVVRVSSYGEISTLNLADGTMSLASVPWVQNYPLYMDLVRNTDSVTKSNKIGPDITKKSIRGVIEFMNFVHFTIHEFMSDDKLASIQDRKEPFYLAGYGNIYINNSVYLQPGDTTVIYSNTLQKMLDNIHKSESRDDKRATIQFLNSIFHAKHP